MLSCANCKFELGTKEEHFAFLVVKERNGFSYHLVLQKSYMNEFQETKCIVESAFIEDKYYIISCIMCSQEIGKKFPIKREATASYLAFGKEKVVYENGTIELKKTDKWPLVIGKEPFSSFHRVTLDSFIDSRPTIGRAPPSARASASVATRRYEASDLKKAGSDITRSLRSTDRPASLR